MRWTDMVCLVSFFFSSRRRHTRFDCDWSSDVCSSDLGEESQRIGPLPIQVFSPAVEILDTLERWGVRSCEALAKLPLLQLSERLGQQEIGRASCRERV